MQENKENCQQVGRRCRSLALPLQTCVDHFQSQGSLSGGQMDALHRLYSILDTMKVCVRVWVCFCVGVFRCGSVCERVRVCVRVSLGVSVVSGVQGSNTCLVYHL